MLQSSICLGNPHMKKKHNTFSSGVGSTDLRMLWARLNINEIIWVNLEKFQGESY